MIELWDGWVIDADEHQFVLGKPPEEGRKSKKIPYMFNTSYHPSISRALLQFFRIQLRESIKNNHHALSSAQQEAARIEKRIRDLLAEPDFQERVPKPAYLKNDE